ncbi:DUF3987 domain-containing protein [Streptomyces adustus]|uniref:DUF3987 domain-containing protein n=1 Tax=Streptomyces adustus TaxID=1609272 RepID=UPI003722DBCF
MCPVLVSVCRPVRGRSRWGTASPALPMTARRYAGDGSRAAKHGHAHGNNRKRRSASRGSSPHSTPDAPARADWTRSARTSSLRLSRSASPNRTHVRTPRSPPGNRKSAVFDLMVQPLLDAGKALIELSGPVRAEAETLAKPAKSAAEKAAGKDAGAEPEHRDTLTTEAVQLAQDADRMRVPAEPQLVADDVTPENVGTLLDEQGGRISCLSAGARSVHAR